MGDCSETTSEEVISARESYFAPRVYAMVSWDGEKLAAGKWQDLRAARSSVQRIRARYPRRSVFAVHKLLPDD